MARRLPVQHVPGHVAAKMPAPARVIHYQDPVPQRGVIYLHTAEEVQAWRAREALRTANNRLRLQAIAERDEKLRRFWLGFGAVLGLAVLTALIVGGWLLWAYLAAFGLGVLAVPAIVLTLSGLAVGGHRCITIVQHWH
jgi:hypothetical protein